MMLFNEQFYAIKNISLFKENDTGKGNIDNFIFIGTICFLLYCLICVLSETLSITMWRHDAIVHRLDDYSGQLIKEGRWLNYLVYPFLKQIKPHLSTIVCLACLWYFGYRCAINFTNNKRISLLFSLSILFIPSFYSFVGWPLVGLPAYILLAWAAYAYDKWSIHFVLGVSIVFLFGTQNNLCNLVPLLYLSKANKLKGLSHIITLWICFYLIGYIVTLLMVRMFGHVWGIQIGEWRHPNPITNFNDFIANIKLSYQCLKRHVHLFGYPIIVFVTIFILYRTIIGLKKTSKKNVNLYTFLLILCIAISFYLQVIPMGLGVADRTTHTLWIALITVGLLAYYYSKHIAVLFFVLVSYSNFHLSYETVHYYSTVGNIWTKYIKQISADPEVTDTVYLCMTDKDVASSEIRIIRDNHLNNYMTEGLGEVYRFAPAFLDNGFKNVILNTQKCELFEKNRSNNVISYNYTNNELFVWINN